MADEPETTETTMTEPTPAEVTAAEAPKAPPVAPPSKGPVGKIAGTELIAKRAVPKSPPVAFVKSRYAHMQARRQLRLYRSRMGL